ncbi:MAG: hypothetical protein ABJE95_03445 [Byssovorax sp.]
MTRSTRGRGPWSAFVAMALALLALVSDVRPTLAGEGVTNPTRIQIPADQGGLVRLVSGGPGGFGTQPHGLPAGAPAQVFHTKWQMAGLNSAKYWLPGLWLVRDHGVPVATPSGSVPLLAMDHSIVVVFEEDGKTPRLIAEMLPEAEGSWNVHEPESEKFKFWAKELQITGEEKMIEGKRGTINGEARVGKVYGLGDHCCTNDANRVISGPRGPGVNARGLNYIGFALDRWGVTAALVDHWQQFGDVAKAAWTRVAPAPDSAVALNLTRILRVGNTQVPYTPSIGGVMMGVSFALHAHKRGVVPTLVSAGAGIVVWEVGTRATIKVIGMTVGKGAARLATRAIPIVGQVLLAADIALSLSNLLAAPGKEVGWFDVLDYYMGRLDVPTYSAGPPPPPDQNAYYD